jgi:uncharacterized membrane protein
MRARTYRTLAQMGGVLGLLAALFAAAEFADPSLSQVCSTNGYVSCGKVLNSGLTTTLGVQDWIWGIVGFLAIIVVAFLLERNRKDERLVYGLLGLTTAGVALSAYLFYVEVGRIGALCPVCLTAYFFGVVAWVGAIGLALRLRKRNGRLSPSAPQPDPNRNRGALHREDATPGKV